MNRKSIATILRYFERKKLCQEHTVHPLVRAYSSSEQPPVELLAKIKQCACGEMMESERTVFCREIVGNSYYMDLLAGAIIAKRSSDRVVKQSDK